jgi:hypothetical protein
MTTIYVILENDQIRFIGKTRVNDLEEKLSHHLDEATTDPQRFEWLQNLQKEGRKPEIRPVFTYEDHESEYYEKLFMSDYKFFSNIKVPNGSK